MTLRKWLLTLALLIPGLGLIIVFMGTLIYLAIAQSFGLYNFAGESGFSTEFWAKMWDRKIYHKAYNYSLYIGFFSALLSVGFAYPIAVWLRRPFPGSTTITAVLRAPLLVHGLVAAFLYINVISYHGILNQFMIFIGIWDEPRRLQNDNNAIGILILQAWKGMPYALLILTGSVQAISDDVLDAGRDLGAGTFARFRKIIAPLSLPAMTAALVIVFTGAVADFSFQVIAGPTNTQSLSQLMVFLKQGGRWSEAAVVGTTLMIAGLAGAGILALGARLLVRGGQLR